MDQMGMGTGHGRPLASKPKISEDGRRLLREAGVAVGLGSDVGNKMADWLDQHPNAQVIITGKTPDPPLRVFGTGEEAE